MSDTKATYQVVKEVCGEAALSVVKVLYSKKNFSEFKLAEKIDRNINETRNVLYALNQLNLASFIRKKDQKKGWYVYYWTFNPKAVKPLLISHLKKEKDLLKSRLDREKENAFFMCCNRCIRADFEQASGFGFKCPECGEMMNHEDNSPRVILLEAELLAVEKRIKRASPTLRGLSLKPAEKAV